MLRHHLKRTIAALLTLCLLAALPICGISAQATAGFSDVKASDYFFQAVQWAVSAGITSGTSATTFSPDATCTRGQVATFLYAAANGSPTSSANRFADISDSDYFYHPVLWAVSEGITGGTSATTFSPNSGCTRGQVVTFLWRAAGSPAPQSSYNRFTDIAPTDYYYKAVLWAAEQGITGGTSATTFSPHATCTRGQIVTFLYNYYRDDSYTPPKEVSYSAAMTSHDTATHKYLSTLKDSFDLAELTQDSYPSFTMFITNSTDEPLAVNSAYVTVDGGESWGWGKFTLQAGASTSLHIYEVNMQKLYTVGTHTATWYINDAPVYTKTFTFTDSTPVVTPDVWETRFSIPTQAQIAAYNSSSPAYRSPYIAGWLQVGQGVRFSEYAVDFKADYIPQGTYCSLANWKMDLTELEKTHTNIRTDASIHAYAGFQNTVTDKGTTSIMSFWDIFATDPNGKDITIRAQLVYPASDGDDDFGNEGTGAHCIRSFDWEADHWYRMLLQCGTSSETGNTTVEQWVCDLENGQWTKLCVYDTGLKNSCFVGDTAFFLENYSKPLAGDIRTMEVRNPRIRKVSESNWTNLTSAYMTAQGGIPNYEGSYAFGAEGDSFWMITSGVGGDWYNNGKGQKATTFTISNTATGSPY